MQAPTIQAVATEPKPFGASTLSELASWEGPCLTLLIPGSTRGDSAENSASILHSEVHLAPAHVGTHDFVRPLEEFAVA